MSKEDRMNLIKWFSTAPCQKHYKKASRDILAGSGAWLLQNEEYIQWKSASCSSVLWLHGIPGSGKTQLTTKIISEVKAELLENKEGSPLAFFYCARNISEPWRAEPVEIVRALLRQLALPAAKSWCMASLHRKYLDAQRDSKEDASEPSKLSLVGALDLILELLQEPPATIIIDALDECRPERRHEFMAALDTIVSQSANVVKVFVSSRDDMDITLRLDSSPNILISAADNSADIRAFTEHEVRKAVQERRLLNGEASLTLQAHIMSGLIRKAQGMFRWVALSIQNLCDNRQMVLEADVQAAIVSLPRSLFDLYQITYKEILESAPQGRAVAIRALTWLLCAKKPLSTDEFLVAISNEASGQKPPLTEANVITLLRHLVVVDRASNVFRFAHLSVREFLGSLDEFSIPRCQSSVALRCLALSFETSDKYDSATSETLTDPSKSIRMYADIYWLEHYRLDPTVDGVSYPVCDVLIDQGKASPSSMKWIDRITRPDYAVGWYGSHWLRDRDLLSRVQASDHPLLLFGASFGVIPILEHLRKTGFSECRHLNEHAEGVLHSAVASGEQYVVKDLLSQPQFPSEDLFDGLLWETVAHRLRMLSRYIMNHFHPNINSIRHFRTPLQVAVLNGDIHMCKLLLRHANVDPNGKSLNWHQSVLPQTRSMLK